VADAERRKITVLFADLEGFTSLTEELDPEQVHQLIAGCLRPLRDCVTRWGGYVDKFIGDCVMALFGAPIAYENEEERALRAALDMQAALRRWSNEEQARVIKGDHTLRLRIGVNTGAVVTGVFAGGGARSYTAFGDTVNVASRLQGLCEPGEILVGADTYEPAAHIFDFGDEQSLEVRGKREPVRARYVRGMRTKRGRLRGFEGRVTPLIGRQAELESLRALWSQARDGAFRYTLITGPPGMGKTRLVEELITAVEEDAPLVGRGRSYPYSYSTPWEPVAELLYDLYGIAAGTEPGAAVQQISDAGSDAWSPEEAAALEVSFGTPASEKGELDGFEPGERQELVASAVRRALSQDSGRPTIMVIEDLQWADHATLEFLATLEEEPPVGPILMLLPARLPLPGEEALGRLFEALEARLDLQPLPLDDGRELIEAVLVQHRLPEQLLALTVERADGNPLFIEEMIKSLSSSQVITHRDGLWEAIADLEDVMIPDSVESLLSTRLDGLTPSAKRVLQYASIVGRRFWSGVLSDVLVQQPVESDLHDLIEGALVRSLPESIVEDDDEYMFEHLLLQEVAYDGLLKGLRADMHLSVANWFQEQLMEQSAESDDILAYHFERSTDPSLAVPFLRRSAERALERGALSDAANMLDRALSVAPAGEEQAELLCLGEEVAAATGDTAGQLELIDQLETLAGKLGDPALKAETDYRRANCCLGIGLLSEAKEVGQRALDSFLALDDVTRIDDVHSLLGRVAQLWGDYPTAREHYEAALPLHRATGDRFHEAQTLDRLGLVEVDLDDFCLALDYFDQAMEIADELGSRAMKVSILSHRATALRWLGRYEEAEEIAAAALDLARRSGSKRARSTAEMTLGVVQAAAGKRSEARETLASALEVASVIGRRELEAGIWLAMSEISDGDEALEHVGRATDIATETGLVHVWILAQTRAAQVALEAGDLTAADQLSAAAIERFEKHGSIQGPEEVVLYVRSRVLQATGSNGDAARFLEAAKEELRVKANRIPDSEWRRTFLEEVHPNPEILHLDLTA
jgi:class 3 adenylate cyclase/tetratricopeptide (TPR) repeat protein